MQRVIQIELIFVLVYIFSHSIYASDQFDIYRHPSLPIQFEAPTAWQQIAHPEDEFIFELMSSDSIIHVILWYTETEQNASQYLWKMANMKDLKLEDKPAEIQINNLSAWILRVSGFENKIPIRTVLVVIPHGKSKIHPKENRLYIVQIWCPEKQFGNQQKIMEDILKSINIL